jgi:hypothetical protein
MVESLIDWLVLRDPRTKTDPEPQVIDPNYPAEWQTTEPPNSAQGDK